MLEYICAKNIYVILKNENIIQKKIETIFNLYIVCTIY